MAKLLTGREAASALTAALQRRTAALAERGVTPKLAILRCGENESDSAYLRSAQQRAARCGVVVEVTSLPETVTREALLAAIDGVNRDASVHGCLLLRPLPAHLRDAEDAICNRLLPEKDVDGMTDVSAAGVYLGRSAGFAPCTAEAVTVLLDHYGIDCTGKRAVVIGRSPVVGRPAAMLLLERNATVTFCHTRTRALSAVTREADIIVSAAGAAGCLTAAHVRPGQTIIDVSANWDAAKNTIVGDADFDAAASIVDAITPVPGGVGAVTSAVLMRHVVQAAERTLEGGNP